MLRLIRDHPSRSVVATIIILTMFTLRPLPSSILLVALVVLLRITTQWIIPRPYAIGRLIIVWLAVSTGCYISFAIAGSTTVTSKFPTVLYSSIYSLLGLIPVVLSAITRRAGFEFPLIWATGWWLISRFSPIGRLGAWSPLAGDDLYEWMRPFVGEYGIDWAIGGWVEVCSCFAVWYLMGARPQDDRDHEFEEEQSSPLSLPRVPTIWSQDHVNLLIIALLVLAIPSAFVSPLPTALHGEDVRDVGVACVLPPPSNDSFAFTSFKRETRTVAGQAHIVLWPEGAVGFDSAEDRRDKLEEMRLDANVSGIYIGISFTEPELDSNRSYTGKRRNGIAIVSSDGVILEYYKRNFIPSIDSIPQVGGQAPPSTVLIQLGTVSKPRSRWNMTLSTMIGPDFAHPFTNLDTRPTLILGPARTWQLHAGRVMIEMARRRADELGTTVLWCDDGEAGLSGLVGQGHSGVQVGYGSWVKRMSVEVPLNEARTPYGCMGEWGGFLAACLPIFITKFSLARFLDCIDVTMARIRNWFNRRRRNRNPRPNFVDI
ncbi:hypothetical protein FRC19_006265 [Serendipita sp. 401]|nr:hypothetical protein FRC19_006265 [Serendipita sp. 401]